MLKKAGKFLLLLLCAALSFCVLSASAFAEAEPDTGAELMEVRSGTCGDNLTWTLDTSTGQLTISGTGAMADDSWSSLNYIPWYDYRTQIRSVVVQYGVTSIGKNAFYQCENVTNVTLSDSVTDIENGAFSGCSGLTGIELPNSLIIIGSSAFEDTGLENVTIPASVTTITGNPFSCCSSLQGVSVDEDNTVFSAPEGVLYRQREYSSIIPAYSDEGLVQSPYQSLVCYPAGKEGNTYEIIIGVSEIEYRAFAGSALTGITLSDSVTTIGQGAFWNCKQLERITVPRKVTSIGISAFSSCTALREISILGNVPNIKSLTFVGCSSLETVYLPQSITSVDSNVFTSCNALETVYFAGTESAWSAVTIGGANGPLKNAEIICDSICGFCGENLKWNLDSATGILSITGSGAMNDYDDYFLLPPWYDDLSQITSVEVGAGVTHIGDYAFAKSAAGSVRIPASVTGIGSQAFFKCASLNEIEINTNNTSYKTEDGVLLSYDGKTLIYYPAVRNGTDYTVPDGVIIICNNAFYNAGKLKTVTVSDTVKTIENCAFQNCSALESIQLPKSLEKIGWGTFLECSKLETVYYQGSAAEWNNITILESNENLVEADIHFAEGEGVCSGLCGENVRWELNTETGVLTISGSGQMSYSVVPWQSLRSRITSAVIQSGVTSIGNGAFNRCECLTEVSIANSVSEIGISAFSECVLLKTVTIPEGVTIIPEGAFSGCTSLTAVIFPSTLTCVDKYAFFECAELTAVNLGSAVETIGEWAFYNCSSLADISIPNRVASLGHQAFGLCSAVKTISIGNGLTSIDGLDFSDSLESISVSAGNEFYSSDNGVLLNKDQTSLIIYPRARREAHYSVPDTVTRIESMAFYRCSTLKTVTLPDILETIEEHAFAGCGALEQITIPDSVTRLGDYAFENCDALKSVVIGDGLTDTGNYTFWECRSLQAVVFGNSLERIGYASFFTCTSLRSLDFPDSLTQIDEWAFANGVSIFSVHFSTGSVTAHSTSFDWWTHLSDVFFDGTEEEWNSFNQTAGLTGVKLFSEEDYDEELTAEITTEEVLGGVVVTMTKTGSGTIYYTIDGTTPCTASIPYEGPFLLDEAGDWFINAIVVDRDSGTYGDTVTEYVGLEQSVAPEISDQLGSVIMSSDAASGSIYYTFDLTTDPTTTGTKYEAPIPLSETTMIRARLIETGKAPSETVSYVFYVTSGGISYPDDSYSFANAPESFGYGNVYRIGKTRYEEVFGSAAGSLLYDIYMSKWGGSCFGMSATSLMFSRGVLSMGNYSIGAQTVNALTAPRSRDSELTRLIERYQVAQFLPNMMKERNDISSGGNMVISGISPESAGDSLLSAVQKACSGEEPIILILWKNGLNGSHAVVPYKMQNGMIYIYDCNRPNEENVITYTKDSDGTYAFNYGEYSYAVSYNTLSTLLELLEGLQTGRVSLTADGKEQMLVSLNTGSFRILDENGKEVTDYILLRATEDMTQAVETMLYLDVGTYTILNTESGISSFSVSVATESEYNTVSVDDPSASIRIGVEYEHLAITVNSEAATEMIFHTSNEYGRVTDFTIVADYAKVYASTDLATLIETTAASVDSAGEILVLQQNLEDSSLYFGAIGLQGFESVDIYIGPVGKSYSGAAEDYTVHIATDITELVDDTFTLTANVTGAGETAVVYAASYDTDGQMVSIHSWETQAGKTKYPFTIEADTAEVKIYVLDKATSEPLAEALTIR